MNKKTPSKSIVKRAVPKMPAQADFDQVLTLIDAARTRAIAAVNTTLIDLYWKIGEYISRKIAEDAWGQGTVDALAEHIRRRQPNARGFSAPNLRRMRQFFETYREPSICSTLLSKLPWSHNLAILSRCKLPEEREFYLKMATRERWSFRDLQRQVNSALFERVVLSPAKLSTPLRVLHPDAAAVFKDSYLIEFLNLSKDYSEADLHHALVERLKDFLIELGRDFCFVGSHYPVQVGGINQNIAVAEHRSIPAGQRPVLAQFPLPRHGIGNHVAQSAQFPQLLESLLAPPQHFRRRPRHCRRGPVGRLQRRRDFDFPVTQLRWQRQMQRPIGVRFQNGGNRAHKLILPTHTR